MFTMLIFCGNIDFFAVYHAAPIYNIDVDDAIIIIVNGFTSPLMYDSGIARFETYIAVSTIAPPAYVPQANSEAAKGRIADKDAQTARVCWR